MLFFDWLWSYMSFYLRFLILQRIILIIQIILLSKIKCKILYYLINGRVLNRLSIFGLIVAILMNNIRPLCFNFFF